ncbi:MAG: metallophosphoesterase [Clostridia bacterium]|nr:metallophosphoesterase [Clostridia bacterium]
MKKLISVILTATLILSTLSVLSFAAVTKETADLGFAVASDLHYNVPEEELTATNDHEIFWYASRRAAMDNESGLIIDEFLKQCAEDDSVQYVLIPGDLADNGRTVFQEHYDVAEKFAAFEAETGKDIFVIPGNHDVGAAETDFRIENFKEVYAEFGYNDALYVDSANGSYTANLGDKYRLIALDSCDPTVSTEDGMTLQKIMWVINEADKAKVEGRYPILMMHHNLLDHLPVQRILSRNFIVRFHYTTATLFADHGIQIVFSGHEHCSDVTSYTTPLGNKIYDFANTALSMYPLQYKVFYLNEEEITYETRTVDEIDTSALTAAVKGYTEDQISLMNEGLNAYAKGFLKAGIQYRLELSLSMEKMGIAEDSIFYPLVSTAVGELIKLLRMPLYGENSVQELGKEYNIDIPDSSYETGWDLATDLVSWHYAGEEAFDLFSTEVTILLRTVALILKDDLSTVNDEIFLGAANALIEKMGGSGDMAKEFTKIASDAFGGVTYGQYFLVALVSPLLYEFAFDSDGVNDNNGTIEGYGIDGKNADNIFANLTNIVNKLKLYIENFFIIFFKIFGINK